MNTENALHDTTYTPTVVTEKWLNEAFSFHAPTDTQIPKYAKIRQAAKDFATLLISVTPVGPDQSAAIRHIREAVMTANSAIALDGKNFA